MSTDNDTPTPYAEYDNGLLGPIIADVAPLLDESPPSPFGRAVRPSRLARANAAPREDVKPLSTRKFHARRSLVPTTTHSRPDPQVRAATDATLVEHVLAEREPAGPKVKKSEIVEGQA